MPGSSEVPAPMALSALGVSGAWLISTSTLPICTPAQTKHRQCFQLAGPRCYTAAKPIKSFYRHWWCTATCRVSCSTCWSSHAQCTISSDANPCAPVPGGWVSVYQSLACQRYSVSHFDYGTAYPTPGSGKPPLHLCGETLLQAEASLPPT